MSKKSKPNLAKALQQEEHLPLSVISGTNEVLPRGAILKPYKIKVVSNGITAIVEIESISMLRAKLLVERMFNPLTQCELIK